MILGFIHEKGSEQLKKKSDILILGSLIIFLALLLMAVVALNNKQPESQEGEGDTEVEAEAEVEVEGIVLNTLSDDAWEIQDKSLKDVWEVVLREDQLPEELQNAESYTITIDGKKYELIENIFLTHVYNGQVSSIEHTEEEVESGVVAKVE